MATSSTVRDTASVPALKGTRKLKADAARATGESTKRMRVINPQWLRLIRKGAIIKLHVSKVSFETSANFADWGLKLPDSPAARRAWQQRFSGHGQQRLALQRHINEQNQLEAEARAIWREYGEETVLSDGRFIFFGEGSCLRCGADKLDSLYEHTKAEHPQAVVFDAKGKPKVDDKGEPLVDPLGNEYGYRYQEWKDKTLAIRERLLAKRDWLLNNYDQVAEEGFAIWKATAEETFPRMVREGIAPTDDFERYVNEYLRPAFWRRFPSRGYIANGIDLTYEFDLLPLQQIMAEDQAAAASVTMEQRILEETARQLATARTEVEREIIMARRSEIDKFRNFVSDMEGGVRKLLYDATVDALALMDENNGAIPPTSAQAIRRISLQAEKMKWFDDAELESEMRELRLALSVAPRVGQPITGSNVRDLLEMLGAKWRMDLVEIGRPPANRREKLMTDDKGEQLVEYDAGERVGIPATVKGLREVIAGNTRSKRVREMPKPLGLKLEGRQRRAREVAATA